MDVINITSISDIEIQVADFNFDTIKLNRLTDGHPMVRIGIEIFKLEQFYTLLDCDKIEIANFFATIEATYLEQHFHNATHAADVMQSVYSLLVNSPVNKHLEPLDRLSIVIAAATHDIAHPGVNNTFLANKNDELLQKFGKESTLEKFHFSIALKVIEETRILENLNQYDSSRVTALIKELILATDPGKHSINTNEFLKIKEDINLENSSHILRVLKQAIICADISGQARKLEIATQWGERVYEEFFRLGDLEMELGLEVQKLNDRNTVDVNKGQVGFINFCVKPVFKAWNEVFRNEFSSKILENLDFNCQQYKKLC
ncbi:High affinity cAMP-specific 3',5'-cyclic phosphodiesterase 7A isoform X3 [Oopsacas minuta]|uniref:High affinity cAMP-specific 3',5'-cyclic phosphodiesterase 7A isoform X3 n=1 Tax=Oopsacas minuta TaxID=111878 RepID=A0AAV7KBT9_9METZ|nr:High affinity cAMP-specific 3',5'-cyclic phosphodiesterase 7A isoform X3 [Oopsacas minuta]